MPRRHRLAKTHPESEKETQSVRQAQTGTKRRRGTATPIEVRRSPEKPRETRKDPASSDSPTSLRGAERPDRFAKRGAEIIEERPREAQRPPDRQREAWGCLREAQRCSESWRGPGRPRDV